MAESPLTEQFGKEDFLPFFIALVLSGETCSSQMLEAGLQAVPTDSQESRTAESETEHHRFVLPG